ncbi:MAG: M20 family peptidase [Pseudomonadota bacterium]
MRRALLAAGLAFAALVAILLINTLRYGQPQPAALPVPDLAVTDAAAQRLARALAMPTVSIDEAAQADSNTSSVAFDTLHAHLRDSYPGMFQSLEALPTGSESLLFHWQGSDPALAPIALMAHQDVVPVDPAELADWRHPPFAGVIEDGRIWGRGALDNKGALLAICEAVEALLARGYRPARSVYLVFGHDEEIGGEKGARAIAQRFAEQGVHLSWVLDEGGLIVDRPMPGLEVPVALIGVSEKGFLTVELTARAPGGHSSKPPRHGAIGNMSEGLLRLQENPVPARIDGATALLFENVAGEWAFAQRMLFANQWLFRPLLVRVLENQATSDALIRTTTALTRFDSGIKSNVLPTSARATVNFRILPGDSTTSVLAHVRAQVDDLGLTLETGSFSSEPSRLSAVDNDAFALIAGSVARAAGEHIIVSPYMTIAATDSRHFEAVADNVYRFNAVRVTVPEVNTIHGINENIAVAEYERLIRFYFSVLRNGTL